jgi:hypothetical protein
MASECRSLAQVAQFGRSWVAGRGAIGPDRLAVQSMSAPLPGRGIDSDPAEHTGKRAPAGIVRVKRVLPPWRRGDRARWARLICW